MEPLPAAASVALAPVLTGPIRPVEVTASLPSAIHLATGSDRCPALCLATSDAVRLPNALVVAGPLVGGHIVAGHAGRLPAVRVGQRGMVGNGRLAVAGFTVRVTRWWRPPRPRRLADAGANRLGVGFTVLEGLAPDPLDAGGRAAVLLLVRALHANEHAKPDEDGVRARTEQHVERDHAVADGVRQLLGRGPGLTPVGDDVLAGALVTLRALASPAADRLADAVQAAAPTRTTAVSVAVLHHAARGECTPALATLLEAVRSGGALRPAADELLRLGHTSGAGLLWGVLTGLAVTGHGRGTGSTHQSGGTSA